MIKARFGSDRWIQSYLNLWHLGSTALCGAEVCAVIKPKSKELFKVFWGKVAGVLESAKKKSSNQLKSFFPPSEEVFASGLDHKLLACAALTAI